MRRTAPLVRPATDADLPAMHEINLVAFGPCHETSLPAVLGEEITALLHPDWRVSQRADLEGCLAADGASSWVSERDGAIVGFVVVSTNDATGGGEISIIAAHPAHQGTGVGAALVEFAVAHLRAVGMRYVEIGTGGDPFHAPARACYERAGFTPLPLVRYFRILDDR